MAWSPDIYEAFKEDRLAPLQELVAAIPKRAVHSILDLGCGSGAAIGPLEKRWPDAHISALDNDPDMLSRFGTRHPDVTRIHSDIRDWVEHSTQTYDLILSNAALHWVPGHETVFPALLERLNDGGVLAVQMPNNWDQPSHTTMLALANSARWQGKTNPAYNPQPLLHLDDYHRLLTPGAAKRTIWQRTFIHRLTGQDAVLNWLMGSSLGVLIDPLDDGERAAFCAELAPLLANAYPPHGDGSTDFSFRRCFMLAEK